MLSLHTLCDRTGAIVGQSEYLISAIRQASEHLGRRLSTDPDHDPGYVLYNLYVSHTIVLVNKEADGSKTIVGSRLVADIITIGNQEAA